MAQPAQLCWTWVTHHSQHFKRPRRPSVKSRCKNEVTMCFGESHYSSRNQSIGNFVVPWGWHSTLKPFSVFTKGAVEISDSLRVSLVRRRVAYKNFPVSEIRTTIPFPIFRVFNSLTLLPSLMHFPRESLVAFTA